METNEPKLKISKEELLDFYKKLIKYAKENNDVISEAKLDTIIKLYGKEFFSQDITDKVKTFEDACNVTNDSPIKV